jgi:excisionase family DNA binding protein
MHTPATTPSEKDTELAREALRALQQKPLRKNARVVKLQAELGAEPTPVSLPREAFELLVEILGQMANGNGVTLLSTQAEMTTQEAAELLGVSRPHLVSLLDGGKIPHRLVGTHRRVRVADLMAYKASRYVEQRAALNELTREAQEQGLGY